MPSPYKEIPITFEKGLVTEIEESLLDIGQASSLLNYEPAANGALRVRNAYTQITKTGLSAPYNVRGFGAIATGTAVAGAVSAPVVVQKATWPNGDADPVATKTLTLNGVNIGNVLIAVVSENSGLSPTVTGGWTERAVSTGNKQHVRFYTKTAASSTEAFTYTIATARIRALTVYEMKYIDAEDPGTKWAAQTFTSGGGGSDTLTVNAVDTDGGFGIVGYLYDGGTPSTSDSGTSGWGADTVDNQNTRTGVTFEDLDQLDGTVVNNAFDTSLPSYVTPSWTPPSTGILIVLIAVSNAGSTVSNVGVNAITVSGNGLTWHDCLDGGELGLGGNSVEGEFLYAWADLSSVTPTAGAITVSGITSASTNMTGAGFSFVRAIGADTVDPFVQKASFDETTGGNTTGPTLGAGLQDGSGLIGAAMNTHNDVDPPTTDEAPVATIGAGNWQVRHDSFDLDDAISADRTSFARFAYSSSSNSPDTQATWVIDTVSSHYCIMVTYEIRGQGNAAEANHSTMTGAGTAIQGFSYVANKEMTGKMVVWGYTPPSVSADTVDFYIVMAVATGPTSYKVYRIPRDEITSGTWEQIDTITDAITSDSFVSFAQGAGHLIWTSSSMNYPRAIELATLSNFNVTDLLGLAGRTAAYHKDRMFIAGSTQNPSRVYFSDIGLPTDFTTATDFLDIGGDDGEAIQDLSSVEGLLLVPKTNRAYLISGSGVESFFVNELSGGTAAPGRSAIRTPYGTLLAGVDDIWVVQGGGVDPMSRPLGSGYLISGTVSTAYAQDMALVCNSATGQVWRVNLVTGAWSLEEVAGLTGDGDVYIVFSLNGRLYYGTNGSTGQVGGTRTLGSARNYDLTSGGMQQQASTGRIMLLGPSVKYTPRYLFMQLRSHDVSHPNVLYLTIESDLGTEEHAVTVRQTTQRETFTLGKYKGAEWLKFSYHSASSAIAGAIDPERTVLGVETEAPRTGGAVRTH